jgi:replication initiation and membrane attachment protein DnaB
VEDAQVAVKNFTQSHSSYQKPVRKEKLPDWSNDDYDWEEEERKKKEESLKRLEEMGFLNDGLQQTSNDVDVPF